jgi:hypothetical protein
VAFGKNQGENKKIFCGQIWTGRFGKADSLGKPYHICAGEAFQKFSTAVYIADWRD